MFTEVTIQRRVKYDSATIQKWLEKGFEVMAPSILDLHIVVEPLKMGCK